MTLADLIEELARASPVCVAADRFPAALVREALASGRVSEWEGTDCPVGRGLVLSSLECRRRGLELADAPDGAPLERSRWVARGRPGRAPRSAGSDQTAPDVAGDEPGPLAALIRHEEEAAAWGSPPAGPGRRVGDREPPRPAVIVGTSHPCWDRAVERPGAGPCRVCGGRGLRRTEYCLGCCRSGIDRELPAAPAARPRRPAAGG
jgi:hypothetical protein